MAGIGSDFKNQMIIGLAVGSVITVVVLTLVCVLAQCGPQEGHSQETPLVPPMAQKKESV
ncbi:hypothetical protein F4805DRAFT_460400 [Annulohypoxylon moriforme]|nr:hypothetical protein F4805DRAFT_460400 [Annulohypoxylon moriforme]